MAQRYGDKFSPGSASHPKTPAGLRRSRSGARVNFLFIAPERLSVPGFPEMLARRKPALIAVDEAHCISDWGAVCNTESTVGGNTEITVGDNTEITVGGNDEMRGGVHGVQQN